MAEKAIEMVDEQLNCSICLETYTDPKILQCFHVFCQKCLVKLVIRDQQGQLSLSCPICRQVTPVPANGTTGLQSAFHINRLLEILDQHKKESASTEQEERKVRSCLPKPACYCLDHGGREVELFCDTCEALICMKCAIKGGKHHSHEYKNISESFERFKDKVTPLLEPMERQKVAFISALAQLDRQCVRVAKQQETVKAEIRESSKRLHEIIDKRQNELIGQLDQITRRKLKMLMTQRDQIEANRAQLKGCLEFSEESLKIGTQKREALFMMTSVLKEIKKLVTQTDVFTLSTKADIAFLGSTDACAVCESFGRLEELNSLDHSKSTVTGSGTEIAFVGEEATAFLKAVTFKNELCNISTSFVSFQVELVSETSGEKVFGSVGRSMKPGEKGQYVISYQPIVRGRHQLHITANGRHIGGSPFIVAVKLPVEKLEAPILILNQIEDPGGVAITEKGEVVVTDRGLHCVSVFSPSGEKLRSFGKEGSGLGKFAVPCGVTLDEKGHLLVADRGNNRMQKFSIDGHCIEAFSNDGIKGPHGIIYSAYNNKVYVVDTYNHCVTILSSTLAFVHVFGAYGGQNGHFVRPHEIAVDSTGRVYVADSYNHRIQVFTPEGKFLKVFGKFGVREGELNLPYGIAIDKSGLVYVSEYKNCRVSVFTSEGKFVTSFGSKGDEPGQFNGPRELAVDGSGVVYVCDSENHRLQIF